ncbi:two-component regulator propeller domain-containing protein [Paraflavisolibacter sp. H34]|uniref:hybrid sensor histidine kinase/response regulator transcription factor n=1 Tax=Huijunlia imazamoxiresistens TaxID=3127457 RepID=UPI003017D97A
MTTAGAQPKCTIEHYSTEQGLSHQYVTCIHKDREGFMWFGTWSGLNRFDGHSFISYRSAPGDSSRLLNDRIDTIVEDQSGHLWLKAYDRHIYRFDKKTEQLLPLASLTGEENRPPLICDRIFSAAHGRVWLEGGGEGLFCLPQWGPSANRLQRYARGAAAPFRLPSNTISFFHLDRQGRAWVGTPDGLACLQAGGGGLYRNAPLPPALAGSTAFTAVEEDDARLYFGTADGQLLVLDKKSRRAFRRPVAGSRLNALLRARNRPVLYASTAAGELVTLGLDDSSRVAVACRPAAALHTLYEDRTGALWIEPDRQGVFRYDPAARSFRAFLHHQQDQLNFIGNRFRVFEDNNGRVWVNMKGGSGFGYYNAATASLEYFYNLPGNPGQRFSHILRNIFYDPTGVLWFTTYERELVKVIFQSGEFHQQLLVEPAVLRPDNEVRGLLFDRQRRLWVGAKSGVLYVFRDGKRLDGLFVNPPPGGLGGVYSMMQDRGGNLWLGTKAHGLYKAIPLDTAGTRYRLAHFVVDKADARSLPGNDIYALLEDRQGRIWIGSFSAGLIQVEGRGDSLRFLRSGPAFAHYPKSGFRKIRHLALDGAGRLWVATTDGLLVLQTGERALPAWRLATYSKKPGDPSSLGNNDVQFVYRDRKDRMWLATSGGGLARARGEDPLRSLVFRNYTSRDGLPNDYLLSLAEDRSGHLWLATENGLSRFQPEGQIFRNYDSYDGLPRLGFSEACGLAQPGGTLVFGTDKGLISFDPDHLRSPRFPAAIALTGLHINNEEAGPAGKPAVVEGNINYLPGLTLRYNQDIISIDYALLDPRAGDRQGMAYRLVGFDTTWYNNKQQRRATYTNLPPGRYLFEVKSLDNDLYTGTPYRRLPITIQPPPWRTWWAYLLYLVAAGLLIASLRRNALTLLRLRQKIAVEQKLAALKMSFFTNVSHELRTPLTLILNPIEQLARKEKLSPEGSALAEVVRKNAHRMVRFINQLLDLRKVQSDKARLQLARVDIITLVRCTSDYFAEAARTKRIKFQVASEQKALFAWVDAEKIETVLYNLFGNALKFTPAGREIRVDIRPLAGEPYFTIDVQDEGPGVPASQLQDIFELYYEGGQRAGTDLKGTGIGLALAKELVALHGGTIKAANNETGGLTVSVRLPLEKEQFDPAAVTFTEAPAYPMADEAPLEQQVLPSALAAVAPKSGDVPLLLLVEDNDELRAFLKAQLGEVYRVEVAADGLEGWEKARGLAPDLVVSDIMMPRMDGIQLLDKLKNDAETSHIPVVLLSAKYSVESQVEGLKYGADYYITKPFANEFLLACIGNLLRQRKARFDALVDQKKPVPLSPEPIVITSRDETFLKEVIRVVEEKMADPDLNMEVVSETMGMNRNTFYKKFKSLTGMNPVEFVRDMRLQRAKQYLDGGSHNVSEVAYLSGFSSPKYFSTCFREKYHMSPSDYLKAKE